MFTKLIYSLLLISVLKLEVKSENLCDTCGCTEHDKSSYMVNVICRDKGLQGIPPIESWPENVYSLDVGHNNITVIDSLEASDLIRILDLDYSLLKSIAGNVFQKYPKLEHLDISQNSLTKLDKDTFSGLDHLLTLNFSYNNIKTLPTDIFDSLPNLEVLKISGNPLRYLDANIFKALLHLSILDISDIEAHSLPDGIFHTLQCLRSLDLSRNDFTEVPSSALRSSPDLKELLFKENPVKEFDKKSFQYLTKLELLDLSEMTKLVRIKELTFSSLTSLQVLRISYNPLFQYMDPSAFDGIYNPATISTLKLKNIKLRNNALSTLNGDMLPWRKISILDLQGNPWQCDCFLAWIVNTSIEPELSSDFRCFGPTINAGRQVNRLKQEEFVCLHMASSQYSDTTIRTIAALVGLSAILLLVIIAILIIKRRYIRSWWTFRKRGTGAVYYVKAQTNPTDPVDL